MRAASKSFLRKKIDLLKAVDENQRSKIDIRKEFGIANWILSTIMKSGSKYLQRFIKMYSSLTENDLGKLDMKTEMLL